MSTTATGTEQETKAADSGAAQSHVRLRGSVLAALADGIPLDPMPAPTPLDPAVPHAPRRPVELSPEESRLALRNALRYFPERLHAELAPEFARELRDYGHIYMMRFRPTGYDMRAHPIQDYPARSRQAAAIMLMIQNNLDPRVAQFPHELITYGGNGSVFQNWAQYHLVMKYLSEMEEDQTLVMNSGHPLGLFPSHREAPRVVVTNGMMIPNYSSKEMFEKLSAMGVTMYGQMTAGSYCYIDSWPPTRLHPLTARPPCLPHHPLSFPSRPRPQGIVHGTTITVLNAGRKYLGLEDLSGRVYVTSGLGGMSGAQAKAAVISGTIGVVAEVDKAPLMKRYEQGWVREVITDMDELVARIRAAREGGEVTSIGFHGNVVAVWERLAEEEDLLADLGSDQTSLHNPFNGGYYPVQLTFEEASRMMAEDPPRFRELVRESLRRHIAAVNKLTARGMRFWDYGNGLLLEAARARADVFKPGRAPPAEEGGEVNPSKDDFRYPSYVQDIMGDIFSLGFGPFRWVATSGKPEDLRETDRIAAEEIELMMERAPGPVRQQLADNLRWIQHAEENRMVVGSQARILYADCEGRANIALAFNRAIKEGRITAPVVLSRDHHDVSGTDSPFRETSNITDGSALTADMAVQNAIGDAFRGATWVALHNGGGVGWGEVMNGGFGLVLDGSEDTGRRAQQMLLWDVTNGVTRRAWGRNDNAKLAIKRAMEANPKLRVTMAENAAEDVLDAALGSTAE